MKLKQLAGLTAFLVLVSNSAQATMTPIPEPGIITLLGLGAVITILVVRYFRR